MKCEHCGFISAGNFYKCPYCGHVRANDTDVLNNNIKVGRLFTIRLRTLFVIILANIFLAGLFVDVYFSFRWCISYWTAIVIVGTYVLTALITGRNPVVKAVEKIDVFILFALVLASVAFKIDGLFDLRRYFPTFIIPIFVILGTLLSFILLFVKPNAKFRPLWTEVLFISHVVVMFIIFAIYMVAKYGPQDIEFFANFSNYFLFNEVPGLPLVQGILIYVGLAVSLLYLINYNIVLFGNIIKEVKIKYGGEERD